MSEDLKSEYPKEHTAQKQKMRSRVSTGYEPITERLLISTRKETRRFFKRFDSLRMNTL